MKELIERIESIASTANKIMADLKQVPGVADVYLTDVWKDGWHHFRVVLETNGTISVPLHKNRPYSDLYQIKDARRAMGGIRRVLKKAAQKDISIDNIEAPKRVYEYQDPIDRRRGEPRQSGFVDNEVRVEFYVFDRMEREQ